MKRLLIMVAVALIGLTATSAVAQQQKLATLPMDSSIRVGILPNGLTYYLKRNDNQKERADFFISQKVGSILENESQLGLAHFLEHMAFNGTMNFPSDQLIKYLEKIGVKFGENLNAGTSLQETIYNISNVPLVRSSILDSALLVLHDWSNFITLEGSAIDRERGVIREEWRTRNTSSFRIFSNTMKEMFPNCIMGNRIPIGTLDVINNFSHSEIRDYYKKWYRPDLQAIIIVGDIDVNDIEARIKTLFADIPKPINPAKRTYVQIEDNKEPIVSIVTDPEENSTAVNLYFKRNAMPMAQRNTSAYLLNGVAYNLISTMMSSRLLEIAREADPPFQGGSSSYGGFVVSLTKDAWNTSVTAKNGASLTALKATAVENERMRRFGFNPSELERAKAKWLRIYENNFNERDKKYNGQYARKCIRNFTTNEPLTGAEFEYELVKNELASLTVDAINSVAKQLVTDTNIVVRITGPKKDGVYTPAKEEVLAIISQVKSENITAYEDKVISKPLISALPKAGKVVKTESAPFGYTKWTLSNGATVYLKKTDFSKDKVTLKAFSMGGVSVIDTSERCNYSLINNVVALGGLGEFSPMDLTKVLNGKIADISTSVRGTSEIMSGSASLRDFETLMQLTYLRFTQPRASEVEFKNFVDRKRSDLEDAALNPKSSFSDSLRTTLYDHHPLVSGYTVEMLKKADYARIMELYKQRFANARDFSFIFTGNVDADSVKQLVETYIGGLPSQNKTEKWKDNGVRIVKGAKSVEFEKELGVPKSTVFACYSGKAKYSLESSVLMNFISSILRFRYLEVIRKQEGGSYSVSVDGSVGNIPVQQFMLQVSFDTDPKLKSKMLAIVHSEIKSLMENGPSEEDVKKVKEFSLKSHQERQNENDYWQNALQSLLVDKIDIATSYTQIVQSVTPEMVRKAAKKWLSQGNVVEVVMNPSAKK